MNMNHTPTPWDLRSRSITVKDNGEDIVAEANGGLSGTIGEAVANAAFIVQACNSHAALVAAAEKFLDLCPRMNEDDPVAPALFDACEQALAALKLATGE